MYTITGGNNKNEIITLNTVDNKIISFQLLAGDTIDTIIADMYTQGIHVSNLKFVKTLMHAIINTRFKKIF